MVTKWKHISCLREEVQLLPMLLGGQSFRWTCPTKDEYIGVFKNAVWELKQDDTCIQFKCHRSSKSEENDEAALRNYLRLEVNLKELYQSWSESDSHFKKSADAFYAVRMLDQDVIENVFSFICSSNNNITRISSMVKKLSELYGKEIATVNGVTYYNFPSTSKLADSKVESDLRGAGFGYRAKFIYQSANKICDVGEEKWIKNMKSCDYHGAKKELMTLSGVGAKVADCICLMSLGHLEAIPVDTHVFQIASNHYLQHLKGKKSVTDKVYNEIGDYFRELFGPYAGWAHTVNIPNLTSWVRIHSRALAKQMLKLAFATSSITMDVERFAFIVLRGYKFRSIISVNVYKVFFTAITKNKSVIIY